MRAPLLVLTLFLAPLPASAAFHLWDITEVYSNADGSVQFVELFVNSNGESFIAAHNLSSSSTTYPIPSDLAGTTANHHLLFATPAFASQPGAVPPDFTFPAANFMSTVSDTINFAGVNVFTYDVGALPTDGYNSLNEPFGSDVRTTAANSPTNFAGQVGSVPEPGTFGLMALGLVGLARMRGRSGAPDQPRDGPRSAIFTTLARGSG